MPLQAIVEAAEFDALPDVSVIGKDLFVKNEKENKFFLNLPDSEAAKLAVGLQQSVAKLTANNKELLTQKGEANAKVEAWSAIGKTPEEVTEQLKSRRPEDLQKLVEAHKLELDAIKKSGSEETLKERTAREALESEYAATKLDSTLEKLVNKFDMRPSARFALKEAIKVERDDAGKFVTRVYGDDGQPAYLAQAPMTPEQLVGQWQEKKQYPELFNAGTGGGAGSSSRQFAGQNGTQFKVSREASKSNPSLYQQAKEQAAKVGGEVVFID
jgi:hypothetical protein